MLGRYAELKAQLPQGTILFYQVGHLLRDLRGGREDHFAGALHPAYEPRGRGRGQGPARRGAWPRSAGALAALLRKGYSVADSRAAAAPDPTQAVHARGLARPHARDRDRGQRPLRRTRELPGRRSTSATGWLASRSSRLRQASSPGTEVPEEDLAAELERWSPREMVVPERTAAEDLPKVRAAMSSAPRWTFEPSAGERALKRHFGVSGLKGYGLYGQAGSRRGRGGSDPVPRLDARRQPARAGGQLPAIRPRLGDGPGLGHAAQPRPRGAQSRR